MPCISLKHRILCTNVWLCMMNKTVKILTLKNKCCPVLFMQMSFPSIKHKCPSLNRIRGGIFKNLREIKKQANIKQNIWGLHDGLNWLLTSGFYELLREVNSNPHTKKLLKHSTVNAQNNIATGEITVNLFTIVYWSLWTFAIQYCNLYIFIYEKGRRPTNEKAGKIIYLWDT